MHVFIIIFIVYFFCYCFIKAEVNSTGPPSVDDLVKIHCRSERPFKCLPFGVCCAGHEFCYSGTCETCFPKSLNVGLLTWCKEVGQYNVSLMRDDTCSLACQAMFNSSVLSPLNDQITVYESKISALTNASKEKDTHISCTLVAVVSGVICVIVGAVVAVVVICFLVAFRRRMPDYVTQVLTWLQGNCCKRKRAPSELPSKERKKEADLDQEASDPMMDKVVTRIPEEKDDELNERPGPCVEHQKEQTVKDTHDVAPFNKEAQSNLSNLAEMRDVQN